LTAIESLLIRLTDRLPCRIIDGEQGEPYLERYYLAGLFGWHAYLHRFVDSDPDRGLHDHPWNRAVSLVLTAGYDELRFAQAPLQDDADASCPERPFPEPPIRTRQVRPWRLNLLRGTDYHRVVLRGGHPAWTLFLHGPRVKGWGFLRAGRRRVMARSAADFRHRDWWLTAPTGRMMRSARAPVAPALAAQQD
jgi:hypothetical protein